VSSCGEPLRICKKLKCLESEFGGLQPEISPTWIAITRAESVTNMACFIMCSSSIIMAHLCREFMLNFMERIVVSLYHLDTKSSRSSFFIVLKSEVVANNFKITSTWLQYLIILMIYL
jgi:hypothetical protein